MKRILVVDDDDATCEAAREILEALECVVERATDGGAALTCLRRATVDAIRLGARGCIRKPVDTGGVIAALQPLLWEHEVSSP